MAQIVIHLVRRDRLFNKMKVNQALIMAGGRGTRLGMGTKSYILYNGRVLLDYVVESCMVAGIKNIVVFLPSKDIEANLDKEKVDKVHALIKKYPNIKWVQYPKELGLGFRGAPNEVKKYLGKKKPFFLLCGQSPQSASFLNKLGSLYKPNSIVLSGYKYRYEFFASIGEVKANRIVNFTNIETIKPRGFRVKNNEFITHMPYVWNFEYYDKIMKRDSLKSWVEFYPLDFIKEGGECYLAENPISVSEVDYKNDLPNLFKSIDILVKNNYL